MNTESIKAKHLQANNELQGESYSVELIDEFAIKCYGKDDLSPIERNVLDDFIKFLKTKSK